MSKDIRNHIDMVKNWEQILKEGEEKSWGIDEILPVRVNVKLSWTGKYYTIDVPPMSITYDTARKLGDNLSKKSIEHGKSEGRTYDPKIEKYPNDVSLSSYDYKNGEARFSASSIDDVKNWLKLYNNIVYSDKINIDEE